MKQKYSDYCTAFYEPKGKEVWFWDEIKDKPMGKQKVESKEEADHVMRIWQDNAPKGIICDLLAGGM